MADPTIVPFPPLGGRTPEELLALLLGSAAGSFLAWLVWLVATH